jgi:hypothetical protein
VRIGHSRWPPDVAPSLSTPSPPCVSSWPFLALPMMAHVEFASYFHVYGVRRASAAHAQRPRMQCERRPDQTAALKSAFAAPRGCASRGRDTFVVGLPEGPYCSRAPTRKVMTLGNRLGREPPSSSRISPLCDASRPPENSHHLAQYATKTGPMRGEAEGAARRVKDAASL